MSFLSIFSKPYSRLFIVGDNSGWSTDIDAMDLRSFAEKLGVRAKIVRRMYLNLHQVVHYTSQFSLLLPQIYKSRSKISLDYYHGKPEQDESFRKCFEALKAHEAQIARVRVSNREMETLIKTVISPEKVKLIHIGIDTGVFKPKTGEDRKIAREKLGIPQDAIVIGSFQKDGVGWGEGLEPKNIKGPDVFLKVVENIRKEIQNIYVLLSGPSRGFVKNGLEELGIPYKHNYFKDYREIANLYDALDLYIVTSREEGGPKAILESMAKGIPLVTTEVGQAKDLVKNGENAMIAAIDDVAALSGFCLKTLRDTELRNRLTKNGFRTAEEHSLNNQLPLWKDYFANLIVF